MAMTAIEACKFYLHAQVNSFFKKLDHIQAGET
jgi:hypothetical protein